MPNFIIYSVYMSIMANSPLIKSTPEEGLVVLTLNRPECRNALSFELSELLLQHVLELEHDKSTRVVILQGNGKTFCSGLDLKQALSSGFTVVNNERIPLGKQMPTLILEILSRLLSLPQILISAAQGYACGGGFDSDLRFCYRRRKLSTFLS